jgi:hypothetical protein
MHGGPQNGSPGQLVWGVLERDLPTLLAALTGMLTDIER